MQQSADHENRLAVALDICRRLGADHADILQISSREVSSSCRMGVQEELQRAESDVLGIRVWVGARQASVSTNDYSGDALERSCQRAIEMARSATDDPYVTLAAEASVCKHPPSLDLADINPPSEPWLQEQCLHAEEVARQQPGITLSDGAYGASSWQQVRLATSAGFYGSYDATMTSLSVTVIAEHQGQKERDSDHAVARHACDIRTAEAIGLRAAQRTLAKVGARKVASARVPVVFDPRISRSLLSQFASAISGAAIARGTSFLKHDLGKQVFPATITITDEPHRARGLGSKPFDGEGVAMTTLHPVENGVLSTWLLDVRSANQLGLVTNGRASRSVGGGAFASSTNLYMTPSDHSPQALMAPITEGLYVTELFGMGVNLVTGDYSQGAAGFWIKDGKPDYPVSEITIAGHLREMFGSLAVADDLVFDYATNAPTLRIEAMMVGGS